MKLLFWRGRTSGAAFRERFRAALAARFPGTSYEFAESLDLKVTGLPQYSSATLNLERAYREFRASPDQFDAIFERYAAAIDPAEHSDAIDPEALLPIVKGRDWIPTGSAAQPSDQSVLTSHDGLWIEDYNAELVIAYAMLRKGFQFCQASWTTSSEQSVAALRARALRNLAERTRKLDVTPFNSVYLINVGGNFEACLLLLDEWREDPRLKTKGRLHVAVPDRDTLIVAQDDSPDAIWQLATLAAAGHRKFPYPISPLIFTEGDSGAFVPLDFAEEDPSHPIPNLNVMDVHLMSSGGSRIGVIIASPLDAAPRSVFRLYRKLQGHLDHIASDTYREEYGAPDRTEITVSLHADSDPAIFGLIDGFRAECQTRDVTLKLQTS